MKPDYGIIVGRFQVNDLHDGHMELFREVDARHARVIVFVGVAPTEITCINPLDFETRKRMIQAKFPKFTVLPLPDVHSDELWSRMLDQRIGEVADYGNVTLYGGRDSFLPHYKGRFKPVELSLHGTQSGTSIRDGLTNVILDSTDFRSGIIHAAMNMRPRTFPTVDIAICRTENKPEYYSADRKRFEDKNRNPIRVQVLLAQKSGEIAYRFVGGFAEADSACYEDDAKREAYEETGLDVNSLKYIGSARVDDWRYAADVPDKIKTVFFVGWTSTSRAAASDDIANVEWFDVRDLSFDHFIPTHQPLFGLFDKFMRENYASAYAIQAQPAQAK